MIEGRHCADDTNHDRHRVRIATESTVEILHLFVQHGVAGDRGLEFFQNGCCWQLSVQQQVADLEEVRFSSQLVDGVSTVQQLTFFTVDIGDCAVTAGGLRKAGVIREYTCRSVKLTDVDHVRPSGR